MSDSAGRPRPIAGGSGDPSGFVRTLGVFDAAMIVAGSIIGVGIFITPGLVAARLPRPGLIFLVWGLGGAIALCGALSYAELAARIPEAGGQYVFLRRAYHPLVGFLYGWVVLLIIATGALAVLALSFVDHLAALFPLPGGTFRTALALSTLLAFSAVNWVGIRPGSWVQNVLTVAKIGGIAGLLVAAIIGGGPGPGASAESLVVAPTGPLALALGAGLVGVLFSYGGWQHLTFVAEEVRQPRRALPRALIVGVGVVIAAYLSANFAYLSALTPGAMAGSDRVAADAAMALVGGVGGRLVTVAIVVSILGIVNSIIMTAPRLYYAMARDGVFLPWIRHLDPRFRTPTRAIALQAVWACGLVLVGDIGTLIEGVVFADWIFFGLTVGSVIVFRVRGEGPAADEYRVPGFFVVAAAFVVLTSLVNAPIPSAYGTGLLVAGVAAYAFWSRRSGARQAAGL